MKPQHPVSLRLPFGSLRLHSWLILLALLPLAATAQTLIQNTTYANGEMIAVTGPTTIVANTDVTVSSGAEVTYLANTSIVLGHGFRANTGSNFSAAIVNGGLSPATGVQSTGTQSYSVVLGWNAVAGATGYNVYRNGVFIGGTSGTSFTAGNLAAGTTSAFTIRTRDGSNGYSEASQTLSVTTAASFEVFTPLP